MASASRVADAGGPGDGHFGLTLMQERARGAGGRSDRALGAA